MNPFLTQNKWFYFAKIREYEVADNKIIPGNRFRSIQVLWKRGRTSAGRDTAPGKMQNNNDNQAGRFPCRDDATPSIIKFYHTNSYKLLCGFLAKKSTQIHA